MATKHKNVKEKEMEAFEKMKSVFHFKNAMGAPKLKKVVVNSGTGTPMKKDKNKNDAIPRPFGKNYRTKRSATRRQAIDFILQGSPRRPNRNRRHHAWQENVCFH